jgi:nucleotide-binding universal stress UspA family protein
MSETVANPLASAIDDFRRARNRAKLERILAWLTGRTADLLDYDEVRKKLRATHQISRGLKNIPIDAIVGSVGRYTDFTRSFLPRQDEDEYRWANVKVAMTDLTGLPAIEVYQIGDAYFVLDGNHRVSVAREMGNKQIQAHVTELQSKVPFSPDVRPEDLILKAEHAEFLDRTQLDKLRPEADLSVSLPGQYPKLEEHISTHRYFMGLDQQRDVSYEEAVKHWHDTVYEPVVNVIREQGILHDFPDRTEADLYLWLMEHRAVLGKDLHWAVEPETVAKDLAGRYSQRPQRVLARVGEALSHAVIPKAIASGPPPGTWRHRRGGYVDRCCLFSTVLVAISSAEDKWHAVEQAIAVARREGGHLVGLHVVSSEAETKEGAVQAMQAEFLSRCERVEVQGQWSTQVDGGIADTICTMSRWVDLTLVPLAHPPGDQPLERLSSGLRHMIQHCPSPLMAVPGAPQVSPMRRMLLAYDGSPKAQEALYVSTYLAVQWGSDLAVLTVIDGEQTTHDVLSRAQTYLEEHGVQATLVEARGAVGDAILRTSAEHDSELIVMGGYGFSPVLQIALGSAVDQVLRASRQPVLICR